MPAYPPSACRHWAAVAQTFRLGRTVPVTVCWRQMSFGFAGIDVGAAALGLAVCASAEGGDCVVGAVVAPVSATAGVSIATRATNRLTKSPFQSEDKAFPWQDGIGRAEP